MLSEYGLVVFLKEMRLRGHLQSRWYRSRGVTVPGPITQLRHPVAWIESFFLSVNFLCERMQLCGTSETGATSIDIIFGVRLKVHDVRFCFYSAHTYAGETSAFSVD